MLSELAASIDVEYLNTIILVTLTLLNLVILYHCRKAESNTGLLKDALLVATVKLSRAEGKEEGMLVAETKMAAAGPLAVEIVESQPPVPVKVVTGPVDPAKPEPKKA